MSLSVSSQFENLIRQDPPLCNREAASILYDHPEDRKTFLEWARNEMSIVTQSPRLTTLYQKIISIDSSYTEIAQIKARNAADTFLKYIYPSSESTSVNLDRFADDLMNINIYFELSDENLRNCSACLKSNLLTPEEVQKAMQRGFIGPIDPLRIFNILSDHPEFALSTLLSIAQFKGISNDTLENLIPFLVKSSPEQRLDLLLASPQRGKNPLPLFVQLAELQDIEAKSVITFDIMRDLVHRALSLDSENYLTTSPESYRLQIEALRRLVQISFLKREEKEVLFTLIDTHERQDERLLLQYLTPQEKKGVRDATNCPEIDAAADLVSKGEWEELFNRYPKDSQLTYLLIGAFCKRKIDLEDLATAMMFHRAFCNTIEGQWKLLPITAESLNRMDNLNAEEKYTILKMAALAKPNQRFLIMVDRNAIDLYTQGLLIETFLGPGRSRILGFLASQSMFGVLSFGAAQRFYRNLTPIIHLTPTMEIMENHVRRGQSDFALFFPDELAVVHGSTDKTIFPQLHDFLHTAGRKRRAGLQPLMMERVWDSFRIGPELREEYRRKMNDGIGSLYPKFMTMPTQEEMTAYLLDRIVGEIIDGGYSLRGIQSMSDVERKILKNIIVGVEDYEFRQLPDPVSEEFQKGVMQKVFQRCGVDY